MRCPRVYFGILAFCVGIMAPALATQAQQSPRPLAPGVLKTIPVELDARSMASLPRPLPDLEPVQYDPKTLPVDQTLYGQSHRVILYRDNVQEFEFALLGLRQSKIRVPSAEGNLVEKNFWYMVYRVRNTGKTMTYEKVKKNPEFDHVTHELRYDQPVAEKIKFRPQFTLEGLVGSKGVYAPVTYSDVINPVALFRIQQEEDPNQRLLDSQQIGQVDIPMAKSDADPGVWGVAIWEDVDPRIDFARVYVKGVSNAFILDQKDIKAPSKTRTLQLNFYRPGDVIAERRDRVEFGIPLVDTVEEQVNICKRYALPGPILRGYERNELAERDVLVVEADAQISLEDFGSPLTSTLDTGKLPAEVTAAFASSGFNLDANSAVKTLIEGKKWEFSDGGRNFLIVLEPQFWEPEFGKIRFIKTLDHLWIYR